MNARSWHLHRDRLVTLHAKLVLSHAPLGIIGIDAVAIIRWPRAKESPPASAKRKRWWGDFFGPGRIYAYCTPPRNRLPRGRSAQSGLVNTSPRGRFEPTNPVRSKIVPLCKNSLTYRDLVRTISKTTRLTYLPWTTLYFKIKYI